jgi:hypothetical protein
MEKDLMPVVPQLLDRGARNGMIETALIGMGKDH